MSEGDQFSTNFHTFPQFWNAYISVLKTKRTVNYVCVLGPFILRAEWCGLLVLGVPNPSMDMARTYLQPHYGKGVFGNVYLSAGQH